MSNTQSTPIGNIVVLMLENRSFDNILGALYPHSSTFEGLLVDGSMANTYNNKTYHVTNKSSGDIFTTPTPDPGESFQDMNLQIFNNTDGSDTATMGGFVNDWMAMSQEYPGLPSGKECSFAPPWPSLPRSAAQHPHDIMFYYTTSGSSPQLPVTGWLAKSFAVSDAWFGSSPTQTFPNRFFVNCATARWRRWSKSGELESLLPRLSDHLNDQVRVRSAGAGAKLRYLRLRAAHKETDILR